MTNEEINQLKKEVSEKRNEVKCCPICNGSVKDRKVTIYAGLVDTLYQVYRWCGEKKIHEFKRADINHFLGKNDYARWADLVRFGGIVYKPKNEGRSPTFGINMARAKEFFAGKRSIPVQILLNQITNEIVEATYIYVWDFPKLYELLNKEGLYDYEIALYTKPDWERQKKVGLQPVSDLINQSKLF